MRRLKKSRFWPLFNRDTNLLQNIFSIIFYVFVSFPEFSICCRSIIYLFPNSRERTTVRINDWYSVNVWHIMHCNVEIAKIIPKQTNIDTTITYLIRPFCDFFSKMMSFNIMLKSTHHLMELILQFAGIASAKKRERERERKGHTHFNLPVIQNINYKCRQLAVSLYVAVHMHHLIGCQMIG